MRHRLAGSLTGAAGILAATMPAAAQSTPPTRDTTALGPVVVTATRVPLASSSATTTVLSGADLRARGVARVADALREVPGAVVLQSGSFGGTTSLFLRGGESKYTKVLIDGVPANLPGGAYDLAFLSTENIERIEVVRGPASVLYGSDAVVGVVQIFTRDGAGPLAPQGSLRAGSYGTLEGDVGVVGRAGKGMLSIDVGHRASDGLLVRDNAFRNDVASGQYHLRPDARSEMRVSARYSDGAYHYPTDGNGVLQPFQKARRLDRRLVAGIDAGRFLTSAVEARIALGANESRGRSIDDPTAPADTQRFYSRSTQTDRRRSADARLNVHVAPGNVLTAGAELSRQNERADGTSQFQTFSPSTTHFDESRRNAAYYAQWAGEARGTLGYTASARFDDNQRFGGFGTYRIAAAYALPTSTRVRAAVGTSFKEPSFTEQFATAFTIGNPDLDPERAGTWEIGVEQGLPAGRGTVGVTYFDQRFRNLVQYRGTPSGSPPTINYFNVAAANARGVEVDGRVGRPAGPSLRAAYTYLDTRVTDAGFGASGTFVEGDRLLRRPTHSASVTASAPIVRRGSAALTVNYVGDRDDRDFRAFPATPVVLGGYATVDAAADLRILQASAPTPVALTLRVENLLDRGYEAVKNYVAPGRTILAGVRFGPR